MKYFHYIYSLLAIGILAVILPQQNTMGQVIKTDGTGDATLSALTLSGIELNPAFSQEKTYYTALGGSHRQFDNGDGIAQ